MKITNKIRGCLIGGAIGDALGYPVEFMRDAAIFSKYGKNGICSYELCNGKALISDDTQMTLFTAAGLMAADTEDSTDYVKYIYACYHEWCEMQLKGTILSSDNRTWLCKVPELAASREPGITCIGVLSHHETGGTPFEPVNNSKGCGGVMRVAPIGLYFDNMTIEEIDMIGAHAAALTHGHELGFIPAAMLVHIIHRLVYSNYSLSDAVSDALDSAKKMFAHCEHLSEMIHITQRAMELSASDVSDSEAIRQLGEGWVAEEALAIAIYCALRYDNDFEKAVAASVNHSGDSDSTGAITGNIIGAYLGYDAIPEKYLNNLKIFDVIMQVANDLAGENIR